jgi:putative DNA methylase
MLDTAYRASIDEQDKLVAGLGLGMQIFTRFHQVMNADGSKMGVHDALNIIYQEVREYLTVLAAVADKEEA